MTRPDQKASERQTLTSLLSELGFTPDVIDEGEAPDFVFSVDRRRTGVEVTMFQSGTVARAGLGRRQVEAAWEQLQLASRQLQAVHSDLRNVNVGLMFKDVVPGRKDQVPFMAEVAAFIRRQLPRLQTMSSAFLPHQYSSPLMIKYLGTLHLNLSEFAEWYSNIAAGWVGRPDDTLTRIVEEKAAKDFRPTDELWLAIQCSHRISETVLTLGGADDFEAVPELEAQLRQSPFARAYVLTFDGLFEWDRSAGWRNLSPPRATRGRLSFDDLREVLHDPEWFADPIGKAERVAGQILGEMQD